MGQGTAVRSKALTTRDIVYTGIFAALIAVCSWVSIPTTIPFTLQTLGVFMAVLVLGGRRGTLSVVVFILLGAVGLPVFQGFTGGMGVILGTTGGYIIGFILTALIMWLLEGAARKSPVIAILSMVLGLAACYAVGTAWFMLVYARANGPVSLMTALGWCVFPFVIPDLAKVAVAFLISPLIRKGIEA